ncbi:MAG: ATP-binding cassette domain-containing protein [Lewinella sp.]|nr:ATP-binding cassette domain-containing protein [Lewinella sp.]
MEDCLHRVGLQEESFHRPAATYSKGMRQKVGIAIAMAQGSAAMILDEPTSGLDPKASHEFSAAVLTLRNHGSSI